MEDFFLLFLIYINMKVNQIEVNYVGGELKLEL